MKLLVKIILPVVFVVTAGFRFQNPGDWVEMAKPEAAKELVELNKAMSQTDKCSYKVTYNSYDGYYKTSPVETMKGYLIKFGINNMSQLGKVFTVQNKKLRVIVDSNTNTIKVTNPLSSHEFDDNLKAYTKSLDLIEKVKRRQSGNSVAYRLENKAKRGVTAHEIYIENGKLKESVLYYANDITTRANNEYKSETVYPRLQMLFTEFKDLKKIDEKDFVTDKYVRVDNGKLVLNDTYKKFKLTDGRF